VRPVGFRFGTDDELAALHAVEAPIAAETGSSRMPQLLDAYVGLARNLPSQFDDHAWLAGTDDGTPVAAGFCWSHSAGDPRVMECDVLVRADWRRRGIGARLLRLIGEQAMTEGRSVLTWSTFDALPAGGSFSRRVLARVARVNRTSELVVADVDWATVQRWAHAERARALGYVVEMVDGAFPEHLRGDAATLHHLVQTAPKEDLDVGDVMIDDEFVAELDRSLQRAGRTRWTVLVRDPGGVCVGGTELTFEPGEPETVHQQNTAIASANRGLGLAKWAKARMLERIRDERPQVRRVQTSNAFSNASMLAINDALGFRIISTRTEWQADAADIVRTLGSPLPP
jgi:GNAT superfamily N-acetyltransferase